jgi:hypothetical protein
MAVVAALAFAGSSYAAPGLVQMSWTGCNTTPTTDIAFTAGQAATLNLFVFLTNQSDPTQSYQVKILYGASATKTVPDAWRFDAVGCQTSAFVTLNHQPPAAVSKTCLSFQDAGGPHSSLQIKDVSFVAASLGYPTTLMDAQVANAYPVGNVPSAATKYFLMDAEFNQSFSNVGPTPGDNSTCGNAEIPMCFNLASATYIINDGSGDELPFTFHGGATGDWATAHEASQGAAPSCQATPVQTRTWGQIKSQYRN